MEIKKDLIPAVKEKARDLAGDAYDGIKTLDRYILTKNVRVGLRLDDKEKGRKVFDTDREFTTSYSLLKALCTVAMAVAGTIVVLQLGKINRERQKQVKAQKREIRRMKKLCRKADVDITVPKED